MTARLRATQAEIRATISAARSSGMRVIAVKVDGTVIVDDGDKPHPFIPSIAPAEEDWEVEA